MPKTDYNEPWFAVEDPPCELRRMVNDKDEEIPLTVANLTRAAVCVNACAGIPTEVLIKADPPEYHSCYDCGLEGHFIQLSDREYKLAD